MVSKRRWAVFGAFPQKPSLSVHTKRWGLSAIMSYYRLLQPYRTAQPPLSNSHHGSYNTERRDIGYVHVTHSSDQL